MHTHFGDVAELVECARLEIAYTGNRIGGSNPSISARNLQCSNKKETMLIVILTGGSTEIPCIIDITQSYFPGAKLSTENKMSSFGLGLVYDAMRRFYKA